MRPALRILVPALVAAACLLTPAAVQAREHSTVKCSACQHVVVVVQSHLAHPQDPSEARVTHVVENACSWFPDNHRHTCQEVIESHGSQLIHHILRDPHPYRQICQEVGVCAGGDRVLAADRCGGAQASPLL